MFGTRDVDTANALWVAVVAGVGVHVDSAVVVAVVAVVDVVIVSVVLVLLLVLALFSLVVCGVGIDVVGRKASRCRCRQRNYPTAFAPVMRPLLGSQRVPWLRG